VGWRPYLSQSLTQLGRELEFLGIAQTFKGQFWLTALQIGFSQFQILQLFFPGGKKTKTVFP
jgi:hypothetical protein